MHSYCKHFAPLGFVKFECVMKMKSVN